MKTIGLIGGTGWVSSVEYYRLINEGINKKLGGKEYARCILYSLNYGDILRLLNANDDDGIDDLFETAAKSLIAGGADCLALCANTAHKYYPKLAAKIDVPIIHIADATAGVILQNNFNKIGLLGTRITMEGTFYQDVLKSRGIETLVPEKQERDYINETIFGELFSEIFKEETRQKFIDIMEELVIRGAQGIVLGCTEIPLLVKKEHTDIPLFDTLEIHAQSIVDFALDSN